jgi:hypothetical protein
MKNSQKNNDQAKKGLVGHAAFGIQGHGTYPKDGNDGDDAEGEYAEFLAEIVHALLQTPITNMGTAFTNRRLEVRNGSETTRRMATEQHTCRGVFL